MTILTLTCASEDQADRIASELLMARLIASAHKQLVTTIHHGNGGISHTPEVLLTMESAASKFNQIEKVVRKLHSYDTFVLTSTPVSQTSSGVNAWLNNSLQ